MKKPDRFDLEQAILRAWGITEDLEAFYAQALDSTMYKSQDDIANAIHALKTVHDLRMNALWNTFEAMCRNFAFKEPEVTKYE